MVEKIDPSGKDMLKFIQMICNEAGPRIGGSEAESKAGNIIFDTMSSFCDDVERVEFECHPRGFLDWIWVTAVFYILGVISYFFIPLLSSVLIFLGIAIFFIQQVLLMEVVDFLFPKKKSFHVVGKIKPQSTPKNLVLLAGHHDSAYTFPILSKLGSKSAFLIVLVLFIALLNIVLGIVKTVFVIIQFSQSMLLSIDYFQYVLFVIGSVLMLILAKFLRSNTVVMGANDNLTAVAAALECGKYFANNKLKETEVWIVSFAGEEHMRGSKRFVSKYKQDLSDREAMLFNLECLSADSFLLATAETMFLAKHSNKVIQIGKKAAEDLGIPIEIGPLKFAGSDAANFSRKGLHAATLFGLSKKGTPNDWHTVNDIPENLSGEPIAKATEIALHFVELVDNQK